MGFNAINKGEIERVNQACYKVRVFNDVLKKWVEAPTPFATLEEAIDCLTKQMASLCM